MIANLGHNNFLAVSPFVDLGPEFIPVGMNFGQEIRRRFLVVLQDFITNFASDGLRGVRAL
jgi:hypothetical protein